MAWLLRRAVGIDTTSDPPLFAVLGKRPGSIRVTEVGVWPPPSTGCPDGDAAILPFWGPRTEVAVRRPFEDGADGHISLVGSPAHRIWARAPFNEIQAAASSGLAKAATALVLDPCGLSLRHLVSAHEAVLNGDAVAVVDWAPHRLLVLGFRDGDLLFCACRATPRNPGTLGRELLRWSPDGIRVLLCGAALCEAEPVVARLERTGVSVELLDPGPLAGAAVEHPNSWRFALSIAMAMGWLLPSGRELYFRRDDVGPRRRSAAAALWGVPLGLLAVGVAGFVAGDGLYRRSRAILRSSQMAHVASARSVLPRTQAGIVNWQRVLWELAERAPPSLEFLSLGCKTVEGRLLVDLKASSVSEDDGAGLVQALTAGGVFDTGMVERMRASRGRDGSRAGYEFDIRLEVSPR